MIIEPAKGLMEIAPLPASNRQFGRYTLKMDERVEAAAADQRRGPQLAVTGETRWSASS